MVVVNFQIVFMGEIVIFFSNLVWLDFIENIIMEEKDDYFGDLVFFEIICDLFVVFDEDDSVIIIVVESVQKDYVVGFFGKGVENKKFLEYDVGIYLNEILWGVFGCVCCMLYIDMKYEKFVVFFIVFKNSVV